LIVHLVLDTIERLTRLPKTQQKLVLQMLDGALAQAAR